MTNLDNVNAIKRLDPNSMLTNIDELPDQIESAWAKVGQFALPTHYIKHDNVVVVGLGSKVIAAQLALDLVTGSAKVPIVIVQADRLPAFVSGRSLVVALDYSGENRETVAAFNEAGKRGAKLVAVATDGQLESLTRKYRCPFFKIDYGAQPRAAIGYFLAATLGIFAKLGHLELTSVQVLEAVQATRHFQQRLNLGAPLQKNLAKQVAQRIGDRIPVLLSPTHLTGLVARFKQQLALNAKTTSFYDVFPEFLRAGAVGLQFPRDLTNKTFWLVIQSQHGSLGDNQYQKTLFSLLEKLRIEYESITIPVQASPLSETLMLVQFCDYVSYYLAILHDSDPETSEMIEFIHRELGL